MRKNDQQLADEIEARLEELGRQIWPRRSEPAAIDQNTDASNRLIVAIRRLLQGDREGAPADLENVSPGAFRSIVAQRLRALETEIADVRTRINGLIFVALGGAFAQLVDRFFS